MKQIIDGLLYDTELADKIASYDNGLGWTDFNAFAETLYVTANGNYFILGEGGAATEYAKRDGDGQSWLAGEGIKPLTSSDALEWCERYKINADIIVKHFWVETA